MAAAEQGTPAEDPVRQEAFAWLARIRGDADTKTEIAFKAWYAADPRHAETFESVLATWTLNEVSSRTPAAQAPDRLATYAVQRKIRNGLAIAASLVLGLAVVAGIARTWVPGGGSSPARQEQLASGAGEVRTVTLRDGSRVTLDSASRLTVNFSASERRLTLERGRARFDVAHDADHPFIVTAGSREVVAHGTLFDVDLRGAQLMVSLLRGSVEVRKPFRIEASHQTGPDRSGQFLFPGQRLSVGRADEVPQPLAVPTGEADWTTPMLTFEDRPLSEVVASANRYGGSRIVLVDADLDALRYSGAVRATDTMDLAQMIAASFGLDVARNEPGVLRLARRK